MKVREKVVILENTTIVIHGCTDTLSHEEYVKYGYAIIRNWEPEALRLNGEYVEADQLPDTIRDSKLEILNEDAEAVMVVKEEICKAYTDGEYAHTVCISGDDIETLLRHALEHVWKQLTGDEN